MNAKKFFYVCAGLLMLVIAYSVGASHVRAQSVQTAQFAGITTDISNRTTLAITTTGDVYGHQGDVQCGQGPNGLGFVSIGGCPSGWVFIGNVLGAATDVPNIPTTSWSKIKSAYRK